MFCFRLEYEELHGDCDKRKREKPNQPLSMHARRDVRSQLRTEDDAGADQESWNRQNITEEKMRYSSNPRRDCENE